MNGAPAAAGSAVTPTGRADRIDLSAVYGIFRRRIRVFFYTAIIFFDVAVPLAFYLPASYTATAEVVLNAHDAPIAPTTQKDVSDVPSSTPDVETEIQIVTSRDLAVKVVDYLGLERDGDMRKLLEGGLATRLKRSLGLAPPVPTVLSQEDRALLRERVIALVIRNLDVERLSSAYALGISYSDANPVRAAAVANAFARLYTRGQLQVKQRQNDDSVRILGARITALQTQAQRDFDAVQQYRIRHNLLSTTGATLTEQEISAYNQQVATARAEAAADAAQLATARGQLRNGSSGDDVGEALNSPVVHELRGQRAQIAAKFADYAGRYGPRNPDLSDTLRQLTEVDGQIQAEINRTISNLDAKATVSRQRLSSLNGSLGAARGTLAQNNDAMVPLDDLQRRANTSQTLYETYLNRYKEAVAAVGAERADSRMVSDARVPAVPSFPKPILIIALGILLGAGFGIAAAIASELAFSGLTTGDELEQRTGLPFLGGIPEFKTVEPRGDDPVGTVRTLPRSPFAEAVRGVLTTLRQADGGSQVVLVTSALPNEGKTTLSACLGQSAATAAERAIVIDCDPVRRQFSRTFADGAGRRAGLREVLDGTAPLADAIMPQPGSSLFMLPITTPFEHGQLIDQARMREVLVALREHFALIILDTAPVLPVAETRVLALLADRVVFVARWRRTADRALLAALKLLPPAAQQSAGAVLARIDMRRQVKFGHGDGTAFYGKYKSYYLAA